MRLNLTSLGHNLEKVFGVVALILFTGAFSHFSRPEAVAEVGARAGNSLAQVVFLVIHLITLGLIGLRWKKVLNRLISADKFLLGLVGLTVISMLWSAAPEVTLRRSLGVVLTTVFGLYFASQYSLRQQVQLMVWAFGLMMMVTVLMAILTPDLGLMNSAEAAWRGPYSNKNMLGRVTTLSAITTLLVALSYHRRFWLRPLGLGLFGLSVLVLLLTTSKTTLVVFLALLACLPVVAALRWNFNLTLAFSIVVTLVATIGLLLVVANFNTILDLLGKDATLTGRTPLWEALVVKIWASPWLGYGYSAFWLGWSGPSADVWAYIDWAPRHAHNGYLDIAAELGLVGLTLFLLTFLMVLWRAIIWLRLTKTAYGYWPLLYLIYLALYNSTGTMNIIRGSNTIYWVIYVTVAVSVAHEYRRWRRQGLTQRRQKAAVQLLEREERLGLPRLTQRDLPSWLVLREQKNNAR
ncbi:MAG TPA: O-antigen ligase family protein [Anaerolineae bacterium]|nr:O-antigen ligase family protein [Anaerolineae bacterium]HMR63832.1 O-antigen ligase family protein [Anaerolineae bacterium]